MTNYRIKPAAQLPQAQIAWFQMFIWHKTEVLLQDLDMLSLAVRCFL